MYQIINLETNVLIEEALNPQFVKQQKRVDFPICANNLEEANGVVLSDGNTMVGIYKVDPETGESVVPNMNNYTPLVKIVEVPDGPYLNSGIRRVDAQAATANTKLDAQQALQLTSLQGQADQYTTALDMQEQINAQQQLNLTALQGIADLYATILAMQTPTTETEE